MPHPFTLLLMPRRSTFQSPVRFVREAAGLTQTEFAERIGISKFHLQDLELGTRRVTDRVAATIALRWGLDPKSLIGERGRPAFDNGAEITKIASDDQVRAYFRTFPNTRYAQLNAAVPKAIDGLTARIRSVFDAAAFQHSALPLYADFRRWLIDAEARLRTPDEPVASQDRKKKKGAHDRPDEVASIRQELGALAPIPELEAAIIKQMKDNISRPK